MENIKAFFAKAFAAVKSNGQHVVFGYPFTSGAILVVGFVIGFSFG